MLNYFKELDLHMNKHIPHKYKTASVSARRELLAGLIDSDGHTYKGNGAGTIEFTNKNKRLANDVVFIARSLGLGAFIHYINNFITQLWKKMFAFQFIILSTKFRKGDITIYNHLKY